ncbi:LysR family transcriptional regulator [Bacillus subtilis subsp. subtilis]|nr:LysR family transcriptional regulator [Bacillus subtilis subsp. subtilis]
MTWACAAERLHLAQPTVSEQLARLRPLFNDRLLPGPCRMRSRPCRMRCASGLQWRRGEPGTGNPILRRVM